MEITTWQLLTPSVRPVSIWRSALGNWSASAGLPGVILSTTKWPAGGKIRKAMPQNCEGQWD